MGETIGQRVRRLRQRRGLSMRRLGEAIDRSKDSIWQLESGMTFRPEPETLRRLAGALQTTESYLLFGDDEQEPDADKPEIVIDHLADLSDEDRRFLVQLVATMQRRYRDKHEEQERRQGSGC